LTKDVNLKDFNEKRKYGNGLVNLAILVKITLDFFPEKSGIAFFLGLR